MKTIKEARIIGVLILSILYATGCDDFLEKEPQGQVSSENFFQSQIDAESALIGAYDMFHSEYYIFDMFINSDVTSDNCYAGGDNPNNFQIDNLSVAPTNVNIERDWRYLYQGVARANTVLNKVPEIPEENFNDPGRKQQILGEASFLRAFHYFQLVNLWGPVPLVLDLVTSTDPEDINLPNNPTEAVYEQIIFDLEFALDVLPQSFGNNIIDKSRVTQGAAHAMLARAYAFRPSPDWEKVREHSEMVISSGQYSLLTDFDNLFDEQNENSEESILEIQFTDVPEASWGPQMWLTPSLTGDSWRKFNTPSNDLIAAFESENDEVRLNSSLIIEGGVPWTDEFYPSGDIPFPWKWRTANGWASQNNTILLRLAEVILWHAEALNELGNTAGAIADINQIRNRAELPNTSASSVEEIRQAIYKERRLELAFEGLRWFDLKRTGQAINVMNNIRHPITGVNLYNMSERDLLWPIPQIEMDKNTNLVQNQGY